MNIQINAPIELISKSKIRYIGTLTKQTKETITIINVKSYGTEERECLHFVEPSDNTYEIMTFKICNIEHYRTDKWRSFNKQKYGQFLDCKIPDFEYEFEDQSRTQLDKEELEEQSKTFYDAKKSFFDDFNR